MFPPLNLINLLTHLQIPVNQRFIDDWCELPLAKSWPPFAREVICKTSRESLKWWRTRSPERCAKFRWKTHTLNKNVKSILLIALVSWNLNWRVYKPLSYYSKNFMLISQPEVCFSCLWLLSLYSAAHVLRNFFKELFHSKWNNF